MNVAAFALQILMQLPGLINAGVDIFDIVQNAADKIKKAQTEGRDITDAEWDESNSEIAALQAELEDVTKDVDLSSP